MAAAEISRKILQENATLLDRLVYAGGGIGVDREGRLFVVESKFSKRYLAYLFTKMPISRATAIDKTVTFYLENKTVDITAERGETFTTMRKIARLFSQLKAFNVLTDELQEAARKKAIQLFVQESIRIKNFPNLYAEYWKTHMIEDDVRGNLLGGGVAAGEALTDIRRKKSKLAREFLKEAYMVIIMMKDPRIPYARKCIMGFHSLGRASGASGSYWLRDPFGKTIGIFKPCEEEIGMEENPWNTSASHDSKTGIEQGSMWRREIAASRFYRGRLGFIPLTEPLTTEIFRGQERVLRRGSLQKFVENAQTITQIIDETDESPSNTGDQKGFHALILRDILMESQDRHMDNVLFADGIPYGIDNGFSFPRICYSRRELIPMNVQTQISFGKIGRRPLDDDVIEEFNSLNIEDELEALCQDGYLTLQEVYGVLIRYELLKELIDVEPRLTALEINEAFTQHKHKTEIAPINIFLQKAFTQTNNEASDSLEESSWLELLLANFSGIVSMELTEKFINKHIRILGRTALPIE